MGKKNLPLMGLMMSKFCEGIHHMYGTQQIKEFYTEHHPGQLAPFIVNVFFCKRPEVFRVWFS